MITFIFPGYSRTNSQWLDQTAKNLKFEGQIRPVYYDHWEDPKEKFIASEKAIVAARHLKGEKANVIAKSIGTLITGYLVKEVPTQINKIILCGIPINDLSEEDIEIIRQIPHQNLVVIQNDEDPHGTYEQVKELFPNFKIIKKEANTHDYFYFEDINLHLQKA